MKFDVKTNHITDIKPLLNISLIIGILGAAASCVAAVMDQKAFFHSYLTGYTFWTTLVLGGLFFILVTNVTGAVWSVVLRRFAEAWAATIPVLVLLFIPLVFGIHDLYHWSHHDAVSHDHLLQWKAPFLNRPFFIIRTVIYFLVWIIITVRLLGLSIRQSGYGDVAKMKKDSAWGLAAFAITFTFACFDWLMSLDPHWYSTIYGVYHFGGAFLGFLTFLLLILVFVQSKGVLKGKITTEHYHDLGKLIFGFTVFWAYIAAAQYFLIWYGNIPEETIWYRHRGEGSWMTMSIILIFGHFVIPFLTLIFYRAKRSLKVLIPMSILLFVMHYIDIYWNVFPNLHPHGVHFSWVDAAGFLAVGGFLMFVFWQHLAKYPVVPENDPRLEDSYKFVNH